MDLYYEKITDNDFIRYYKRGPWSLAFGYLVWKLILQSNKPLTKLNKPFNFIESPSIALLIGECLNGDCALLTVGCLYPYDKFLKIFYEKNKNLISFFKPHLNQINDQMDILCKSDLPVRIGTTFETNTFSNNIPFKRFKFSIAILNNNKVILPFLLRTESKMHLSDGIWSLETAVTDNPFREKLNTNLNEFLKDSYPGISIQMTNEIYWDTGNMTGCRATFGK